MDKLVENVADNIGDYGLSLSAKEEIARRVIPIIREALEKEHLKDKTDYGISNYESGYAMGKQETRDKIKKELEITLVLERCDPDTMPYFTDYYWIPKDVWQDYWGKLSSLQG